MNSIDAVISWVDGYDPAYQQKLRSFCQEKGLDQNIAVEPTRIQQVNEIHYCLLGLRRFAPWIRNIYIITNQQTPPAVTTLQGTPFGDKIKIIDQNDLLSEANATAPVFNSISIEWLIWRIKGLSNQFIYLNDDFFIIKPVTPADFFRNDRLVLGGEWKVQAAKKWTYRINQRICQWLRLADLKPKTNPHRAWQEKGAQLAGFNKQFYLLPHAPFPLIKNTFETYLVQEPDSFKQNIRFPFRHPDQISSIPLMVHLDIQKKRVFYHPRSQTIMVNGATHPFKKIKSRLCKAKKNPHIAFVCMQSLDQAPPSTQQYLISWLQTLMEDGNCL